MYKFHNLFSEKSEKDIQLKIGCHHISKNIDMTLNEKLELNEWLSPEVSSIKGKICLVKSV